MNCISYLGTSTFTDQYFVTTYNSSLVVHTSPSYSGTFGTIPLVKDGRKCVIPPIQSTTIYTVNDNGNFSNEIGHTMQTLCIYNLMILATHL